MRSIFHPLSSILFFLSCLCAFVVTPISHAYDLSQVKIEHLQNGLTVMLLEDHTQPLVSTQVLYKVGARNECVGTTGLAHFVEHMAFRATKNFPGTDVVSRIYGVGGEWHGYTFLDQTTYFETVPVKDFDLVLQIQADRMGSALIKASEVEAERGAVLTELHSYENDPALVLNDAVNATSFLQHPYRYNTIGWTSDVEKIAHDDIVEFYHRYYHPSNAVLAIAGDIDSVVALQTVHRYFDSIPAGSVAGLPRTVEPLQQGERRLTIRGSGPVNTYQITYRAPAARDPEYPAYLLLQAVLGGGSGVNFRQEQEAEPAHPQTRLHGVARKITTFFIPTAQPYVFTIAGSADPAVDPAQIENEIEKRISPLLQEPVSREEIDRSRKQLQEALLFDIETTEDAAHQMAYFEGIGAFPVLQKLPDLLNVVTPADIQAAARKYLQPQQRTIGWYLTSGAGPETEPHSRAAMKTAPAVESAPKTVVLKNGAAVIVRRIPRTPAGFIRVLIPSNTVEAEADFTTDTPVWRYTSVHRRFLREDLAAAIREVRNAALKDAPPDPAALEDPETAVIQTLAQLMGAGANRGSPSPAVICVVGDIDEDATLALLKEQFGSAGAIKKQQFPALHVQQKEKTVRIPGKAQSQFGYALPAPAPSSPGSVAYRILLYIMTHAYEGRLGKEMIGRRGLIYYISSSYNSDGVNSWISIHYGVNPDQLDTSRAEFERILKDLRENPPTEAEVEEAKQHLIGRRLTQYQSNEELSAFYVREWIEQGRLLDQAEFEKRIRAVTLEQVRRIIPQFLDGVSVVVDTR